MSTVESCTISLPGDAMQHTEQIEKAWYLRLPVWRLAVPPLNHRRLWMMVMLLLLPLAGRADWPQWGGPQGNFKIGDVTLAEDWPAAGLPLVWRRPLGDGYSSVVTSGNQLVTMYRADDREHLVALDASSGETLWRHSYAVEFVEGTNVQEFGPGPLSTPLIRDGHVCAVGVTGMLHCVDLASGKIVWKRDLVRELHGTKLYRGYSASPIGFRDTVILPVGGAGRGLVSFRMQDGAIAWQKHDFEISHVSPVLIRLGEQTQLVVTADKQIVAVDPATGRLLWRHEHPIRGGYISSTPVWHEDGRLFFSAAYGAGSRCLELTCQDDRTTVQELWHQPRMRVHHSNVIRVGDVVYGSSGDFSALLLTALDIKTGNVLWQERQKGRASAVYADGKFILLREDGTCLLARLTPKGMTVQAEAKLFDGRGWTAPTLDGKRLYVRNRKEIMAWQLP